MKLPELIPASQHFTYWDYNAETRELIHRRSRCRIVLDDVLSGSEQMLRCFFEVHNKPWGNAKVLDELVELIGTYFKGEWLVRGDGRPTMVISPPLPTRRRSTAQATRPSGR